MGLQDRDWYREEMRERQRSANAKSKRRLWPFRKRQRRIPVDLLDNANPPKLWGADWHWSLKLLVWLCIATLLLIIGRLLR